MTKVALVLNPVFGDQIADIASEMPVWVLSSSDNAGGIRRARQSYPNQQVTELLPRGTESSADLLARALLNVDEHYGPDSSSDPYEAVLVYGAQPADVPSELAAECGFKTIEQQPYGFIAWRRVMPGS